jgi:hypothetical protein
MKDSFDMFMTVVKKLAGSQGLYSRMLKQINSMTEDELDNLRERINQVTFKNEIDVIMFVES